MRILVNDIAASSGGALSVLKDFYEYIKNNDTGNEWIFLLSDKLIEETDNIKVVLRPDIKKNKFKKVLFDLFFGKSFVEKLNPDVVFSLQNIIIFGLKKRQYVYIHQPHRFQDVKMFSFLKRNEFEQAVRQYLIGSLIVMSAKRADGVFVQTEWMKKSVAGKSKISSEKIIISKPFVCKNENIEIRAFDCKSFFYPTLDIVYKNNELIYEACNILLKKGIKNFNVKLTINSEIKRENICFCNRLSHKEVMSEYYKSTLVFPSYIETYGYPLAEAQSVGTIILAANCEYAHELLDGYENAYFFDYNNPCELASLMEKIIKGEIAKRKVENKASSYSEWDLVYNKLLGRK